MNKYSRPRPISQSSLQTPASVRFLLTRVMREILTGGTIEQFPDQERGDVYIVNLEKLRIVISKGMTISHRMGVSVGRDEMQSRRRT
jgi:hypothetical protein